jgi:two-component system sensor histidine kinase CpxA
MRLFWRIFLSFWLATILMMGVVLAVREALGPIRENRERPFKPELTVSALSQAINVYEQQGSAAFLDQLKKMPMTRDRSLSLFDQQGKLLIATGVAPPSSDSQVAQDVIRNGHAELRLKVPKMVFVCPIRSSTGRQYAVALTLLKPQIRLARPRVWISLLATIIVSALICMTLTLYLTKPISRLREAAQRLARGDLTARATSGAIARGDELGELTRDFDLMAARIQSLMTAQRRLVADVSHELGSPLTRMHLAIALLRRQLGGRNDLSLERLDREAGKLSDLVQQLLLVARLEAGSSLAETLEPVSMQSLCQSIVEDADFEAQHKSCRIALTCEDATLLVYPQMLRRAIDNVLKNAIRYAPTGTDVVLDCRTDLDLRQIVVEVLDCGPGVPDDMLTDIFLPFFRTSDGRDSKSGGAGLGLAIAHEAVRLHDGFIMAKNREGGGLQVTIALPLRSSDPRPPRCEPSGEPRVAISESTVHG